MNPIRVALLDDHRVVSRSLRAFLELFADIAVVGTAASGEELLERLSEWKPHVAIADLLLPGGIDGVETTRRILKQHPGVRVVALTASTDGVRMMAVLRAGAAGYVRKDADPETLLVAVRAVAAGRTYIDPGAAASLTARREELSPREADVLRQMARGRSNKEIGSALGISEETVKSHVSRVLGKFGVENRTEALLEGLRRGILVLDEIE